MVESPKVVRVRLRMTGLARFQPLVCSGVHSGAPVAIGVWSRFPDAAHRLLAADFNGRFFGPAGPFDFEARSVARPPYTAIRVDDDDLVVQDFGLEIIHFLTPVG